MPGKLFIKTHTGQRGFTLMELLVSLMIASVITLGALKLYSNAVKLGHDQKVRTEALVKAQAALQMIGSEVRVLGNGVPFDQSRFQIGETGPALTDSSVTQPILLSSLSSTKMSFRLNESGEVKLLTADFTPSTGNSVQLTDVDGIDINDPVYITNGVVGGRDGFYGIISGVSSATSTVTIAVATMQYNEPAAVFNMGSILEVVPLVTWESKLDGSGIVRNSGYGDVVVADKSTFQLEYLNDAGAVLPLPITEAQVVDNLRAIRITVTTTNPVALSNGTFYTVTIPHTYAIRNLNILY